jgi:hypothetical protein
MKSAAVFIALTIPLLSFAEPATTLTVEGRTIRNIVGVSLDSDGAVSVISGSHPVKLPLASIPESFLLSWDITKDAVEKQKLQLAAAEKETARQAALESTAKAAARAIQPLEFTPREKGGIELRHTPFAKLRDDEDRMSRMLNQESTSRIPRGGKLEVIITRRLQLEAMGALFTVIVFDKEGNELMRHRGSKTIPGNLGSSWLNIVTVPLDIDLDKAIIVRVVDAANDSGWDFQSN